jgi:hypothetical protein
MLIEYKIKFEKDGLTIAQHIEPNSNPVTYGRIKMPVTTLPAAQDQVRTLVPPNPLVTAGAPADRPGGAPGDIVGGAPGDTVGGAGAGSAPIFILGPIVFGNSVPESRESTEPQQADQHRKARGAATGR